MLTRTNPDLTGSTLTERLGALHQEVLAAAPEVDRIACALYDPEEDLLRTFIDSSRGGTELKGYEFKLSESRTLARLSADRSTRVIDDVRAAVPPGRPHSTWLLEQGFESSFTVPVYDRATFMGFVFFDSRKPSAFNSALQQTLTLYSNLIALVIANELATIQAIVGTVQVARDFADLRDIETGGHLERMSRYARLIARTLAPEQSLTDEFVEHVFLFAPLHDIGKIGIPDRILLKPGKLDPEERSIMETHVEKGCAIVDKITADFHLERLPHAKVMRNIVRFHHECPNGAGYPARLKGEAIPLEARIVTVADIFDALTSRRPYKAAWTFDDAYAELQQLAEAGRIDPACVAALRLRHHEAGVIGTRYRDS